VSRRAHPALLARRMDRLTTELEPVIGERAALLFPWASLWLTTAALLLVFVFAPTYWAAAPFRSAPLIVAPVVSGAAVVLAFGVGSVLLVKVNRAAGCYISDRSGVRMRFWGGYTTAAAWERAIRRKARKLAD
jgi:hypothetical protein